MGTSFPPICTLQAGRVNSTEAKDLLKDRVSQKVGTAIWQPFLDTSASFLLILIFLLFLFLSTSLCTFPLPEPLANSLSVLRRAVQAKEDWHTVPVWWEADDFGEYISLSSLPSSSQFNKSPWKVSLDRWILPLFWTVQPWQIWYNSVFMCFVQWCQSFPSCTRTGSSLDNMSLLSPDHRRGNDGVGGKHQGKRLKKTLFYFGG